MIEFDGEVISAMTPERAAALGVPISYQHPAVLDDLSVLENLRVALPDRVFAGRPRTTIARADAGRRGAACAAARARRQPDRGTEAPARDRQGAGHSSRRVLILDEPTAALDQDATDMLFARIRSVVAAGTAVIYITHRLAELRQIAHRVTVLRDGQHRRARPGVATSPTTIFWA